MRACIAYKPAPWSHPKHCTNDVYSGITPALVDFAIGYSDVSEGIRV